MRIGLYLIFAMIFTALVGAFVYTLQLGDYSHSLLGISLNLPVFVWVTLPVLLLMIFSVLHMAYYGTVNFFARKRWEKDAATFQDALYWSLLKEPKEHKYSIKQIGDGAKLLANSTIDVAGNADGISDKFRSVIGLIQDVNRGEYVNLKEKKLANKLSKENPILIKNNINRLSADPKFVEEVLQSTAAYNKETIAKALEIFAQNETFFKAKKYAKLFDVENFFVLLERAAASKEDIGMNEEMIKTFVTELPFRCREYMHLAKVCLQKFTPDSNLEMFKGFRKIDEDANQAYLYLLFEYEMLDAIEEFLNDFSVNEFVRFRALFTIKKSNHKYNIESLVSSYAVCDEN